MKQLRKSSVVIAGALGLFTALAAPVSAQPAGNLGNGIGSVGISSRGIQSNSALGSFGFSFGDDGARGDMEGAPGGVTSGFAGGPNAQGGPQGQTLGGSAAPTGASGGTAFTSQARPGQQSRESAPTNNYALPDSRPTNTNSAVGEEVEVNLLSTFSVNPFSYPSGTFDYGFPSGGIVQRVFGSGLNGFLGTVQGGLQGRAPGPNGSVIDIRRGWYLPQTSTSSVDFNTVSP